MFKDANGKAILDASGQPRTWKHAIPVVHLTSSGARWNPDKKEMQLSMSYLEFAQILAFLRKKENVEFFNQCMKAEKEALLNQKDLKPDLDEE